MPQLPSGHRQAIRVLRGGRAQLQDGPWRECRGYHATSVPWRAFAAERHLRVAQPFRAGSLAYWIVMRRVATPLWTRAHGTQPKIRSGVAQRRLEVGHFGLEQF